MLCPSDAEVRAPSRGLLPSGHSGVLARRFILAFPRTTSQYCSHFTDAVNTLGQHNGMSTKVPPDYCYQSDLFYAERFLLNNRVLVHRRQGSR